ncbi:MAG: methionine biosynthesis protein MetW [Proteobacteria bacterium]|nr:methionine biosynthesis protein MetW [Pseudomonadota bacterium]
MTVLEGRRLEGGEERHQNGLALRRDLQLIADQIEPGTRVLDIGCGDGALLSYLNAVKHVDGRGIELSGDGVNACVAAGLSVIQGDANTDLRDYPDGAFDYAVLSQTLQATRAPRDILEHLTRIGRRAIVSFPNFGYWRVRVFLSLFGRMPVSDTLPHQWHNTPNIHLCTISDFLALCDELGIRIERKLALNGNGRIRSAFRCGSDNLLAEQAGFVLSR